VLTHQTHKHVLANWRAVGQLRSDSYIEVIVRTFAAIHMPHRVEGEATAYWKPSNRQLGSVQLEPLHTFRDSDVHFKGIFGSAIDNLEPSISFRAVMELHIEPDALASCLRYFLAER